MSNIVNFTPHWRLKEYQGLIAHGYPATEAIKLIDHQEALIEDRGNHAAPEVLVEYKSTTRSASIPITDYSRDEILSGCINGIFTWEELNDV